MEKVLFTDKLIDCLSKDIGTYPRFRPLGIAMKIPLEDMIEMKKKNEIDHLDGIATLLLKWRNLDDPEKQKKQIPKLKTALKTTKLTDVASSFFAELAKLEKASEKAQLRKEGKAGTSTATADNKPRKSTPAKKETKTMETKPTSGKKLPHDDSKPGASKKQAKAKDAPKRETSTAVTTKETITVQKTKTVTEKKGTK